MATMATTTWSQDSKPEEKLVEKPWNTMRDVKKLPAPTREEVYQACKLAVTESKDLIEQLLLSSKRDVICCEKILDVDGEVISSIFEQIRAELF